MATPTIYNLPDDFPKLSKSLLQLLGTRCTNCGDADPLFPSHGWKNCPFFTPPHRSSLWPAHHSPIFSIAEGGKPRKSEAPAQDFSTKLRNITSYHATFASQESTPAPSGHTRYEF